MKICVIGTGYVGLVTGACFADMGNEVVCMDVDEAKITQLGTGVIPIYEPGLEELVKRNQAEERLVFTTDIQSAVEISQAIFIAVGTPPGEDGSADLRYVLGVAQEIGRWINDYKVVVNKSTVPVGTADKVAEVISRQLAIRNADFDFDVVSNPEFLKEGSAITDFMKPDRVVIGTASARPLAVMQELYSPFVRNGHPIINMDLRSAELTKYAANAMLASRISFINEIANICERVGADVASVRLGVGSDSRIGMSFLHPGVGYGGSCFPKDVQALLRTSQEYGYQAQLLNAIEGVNHRQKLVLAAKIKNHLGENLTGKTIAIWGLAFKPNTDDMREAPSRAVIRELAAAGAAIRAYDPVAIKEAKRSLAEIGGVTFFANQYETLSGADALALVTEWHNFRKPDFARMARLMNRPVIFDGRNQYDPGEMKKLGFLYFAIGRPENNTGRRS